MTSDVALGKLATIERCLERIRTVTGGDPERVDQIDVEEIVVLNYERLDREILKRILRERLGDLAAFAKAARTFAQV